MLSWDPSVSLLISLSVIYMYCSGLDNEGTIDTWQLLAAIREKNITLGVQVFFVAVGIYYNHHSL